MAGRLLSVNLAVPRTFEYRGRAVPTGIFKEPAAGRVRLRELSLEGDIQADRRYHGGAEKAVYAYPSEHYPHWKRLLGRDLPAGFFGENFTTEGLREDTVHIGDILRVGTALVQVTQPRSPCFKLGLRVGSARFIKIISGEPPTRLLSARPRRGNRRRGGSHRAGCRWPGRCHGRRKYRAALFPGSSVAT